MRKFIILVVLAVLSSIAIGGVSYATGGGHDKPWVCHPVNGKGETGNGWNLIKPSQASSHIDEATGAGKHVTHDGRTDVYANGMTCPTTPTEDPEPTNDPEPTDDPTPSDDPEPTDVPDPTPSVEIPEPPVETVVPPVPTVPETPEVPNEPTNPCDHAPWACDKPPTKNKPEPKVPDVATYMVCEKGIWVTYANKKVVSSSGTCGNDDVIVPIEEIKEEGF